MPLYLMEGQHICMGVAETTGFKPLLLENQQLPS